MKVIKDTNQYHPFSFLSIRIFFLCLQRITFSYLGCWQVVMPAAQRTILRKVGNIQSLTVSSCYFNGFILVMVWRQSKNPYLLFIPKNPYSKSIWLVNIFCTLNVHASPKDHKHVGNICMVFAQEMLLIISYAYSMKYLSPFHQKRTN